MAVNEPVELDVVVVLAKGVDEHLGHLQPPHVEAELPNNDGLNFI